MSESHDPNQLAGTAQDLAPLAWVIDEIRISLAEASSSVRLFAAAKQDVEPLRVARNHVHQTHGALELLDLRGVALVTDAVEQLLRRWEERPQECLPGPLRALEAALAAVRAYLEGLLAGGADQPLRLYPYYRAVQQLNEAARAHPADLVFPDLGRRPALPPPSAPGLDTEALRAQRARYELGLLGFLRNADDPGARGQLREALAGLDELPLKGLARSFWWVQLGLLEALEAGQVGVDLDLKRLLARLNLQLRRLIDGGTLVAERLLVDALYYVGSARGAGGRAAEVRRLFGLDLLIPPDFEQATLTAVDIDALRALRESLAQAKQDWARVAGPGGDAALPAFSEELEAARVAAQRLSGGALEHLLSEVAQAMAAMAGLPVAARPALGLEVASALLFAEAGAAELPRLDPEFEQRARAVVERIERAARGLELPDGSPWLTELARRAQDRNSMGGVVAETQVTLREIEQRLDRYFRDPRQRQLLADVGPLFDQVCGVLAVLGYEEPVVALRGAQRAVDGFATAGAEPPPEAFERIAQSLGAIGFFIETLAHGTERPQGMFRFDPASGAFSANLALPGEAATVAAPGAAAADNIEAASQRHLGSAHTHALRLAVFPDDAEARGLLAATLAQLSNDADLLDRAALKSRVAEANRLLSALAGGERASAAALARLLAPEVVEAPAPTAPMPASQAAAADELLAIFCEEALEVLDGIDGQLARLREAPADLAALTLARRAFHTLKGSGRMVGLKDFGEAAWAVEQCFNLWLAQERPASPGLIALADDAARRMRAWIGALRGQPRAALDTGPLVRAALRVREGLPPDTPDPNALGDPDEARSRSPAPSPAPVAEPEPLFTGIGPALGGLDAVATPAAPDRPAAAPAAAPVDGPGALAVAVPPEEPARVPGDSGLEAGDETRRIGPVRISHGLYSVFVNESDACIRALAQDLGEWRFEPDRPIDVATVRRAHTLAGIAATVGLAPMSSLADPLDELMHTLAEPGRAGSALGAADFDDLEEAVERLRGMQLQFAAGLYPDDVPAAIDALHRLLARLRAPAAMPPGPAAPAAAVEAPGEVAAAVVPVLAFGSAAATPAEPSREAVAPAPGPQSSDGPPAAAAPAFVAQPAAATPAVISEPVPEPRDELDAELLQTFIAEANDLLPAIAATLRALAAPDSTEAEQAGRSRELMRSLHTVKGSARMAGAMALGEMAHQMETRLETAMQLPRLPAPSIDELHAEFDRLLARFDRLCGNEPAPAAAAPDAPTPAGEPAPAEAGTEPMAAAGDEPAAAATADAAGRQAAPAAVTPFIRVRADVLDKLVDHAGEVSIARSKLETEVGTLRGSLTDLTENIHRLRAQLREVEIQADAQIQARSDQLAKQSAAFDPLEFDRYSRLQELTRMLAESVEDVALVQNNMLKGLQLADNDLSSQSRLTRELQQQLMRVRLVPFANLSERLYRVARQAAKELGKRVHLDIRGGATEIDRSVLERMSGPFEHLVRNAIVHGIEIPAARLAQGKPETGTLTVDVRQEGNEILVVFADDGAGLDLERIRALALARGLLAAQGAAGERELTELIFTPGFSTADVVTELAGRGVGMDVVRAELASFGGRIAVASEAHAGARFTLYLPLTLAITQAVLVTTGERRYALPAAMVELVRRLRPAELATALREGHITHGSRGEVPLRALSQLTGGPSYTLTTHHAPLVVLRSGEERLAVVVDDVSTNQEIVVKNVGRQVARLAGILGATVLGSGEIVLIINPVQLLGRAPQPAPVSVPGPAAAGVAGLQPPAVEIVMVVDDSLTVRRVTQRLLERNGYRVLLAKDGVDALRQLQDTLPDAMLVDIEMPRMDGYDLTRNLRSGAQTRDIPILMITSRTADKHRGLAYELGVNEYLGKPYREDELLELLRQHLTARATRRAAAHH